MLLGPFTLSHREQAQCFRSFVPLRAVGIAYPDNKVCDGNNNGFTINSVHKKYNNFSSAILTVWVGFTTVLKSMVAKIVRYSTADLADALNTEPEAMLKTASELQRHLTAAMLIFILIFSTLVYWIVKKRNMPLFNPRIFLGLISCGSWMIIGYYFTEYILYGNAISDIQHSDESIAAFSGNNHSGYYSPCPLKVSPVIDEIKSN